jgi:hypothetical protein
MSGVVQLPRNPLDHKIDALTAEAAKRLSDFRGIKLVVPGATAVYQLPSEIRELVHGGFFEVAKDQAPGELTLVITFDGNNAQLRINSGIYGHHAKIYADRARNALAAARAQRRMESIPGFGTF